MLTTGKGTHYCVCCGFDMKAKEERECEARDGDFCESKKRTATKKKAVKKASSYLLDNAQIEELVKDIVIALDYDHWKNLIPEYAEEGPKAAKKDLAKLVSVAKKHLRSK